MCADPKSAKNIVKPSVFFVLLGSVCIKAARNTLMKSIQGEGEREREVAKSKGSKEINEYS